MFDKYMICAETIRSVTADGQVTGFALEIRMAYYRSLRLSMVEPFELLVDGDPVARGDLRFSLRGRTYALGELATEITQRWEFGERATLTVLRPGGLAPGEHSLDLTEYLRISYLPTSSKTRYCQLVTVPE